MCGNGVKLMEERPTLLHNLFKSVHQNRKPFVDVVKTKVKDPKESIMWSEKVLVLKNKKINYFWVILISLILCE